MWLLFRRVPGCRHEGQYLPIKKEGTLSPLCSHSAHTQQSQVHQQAVPAVTNASLVTTASELHTDTPRCSQRYPRGYGVITNWKQPFKKLEIGKGEMLKEGKDIAVLSVGFIAQNVKEAILKCFTENAVAHYDMRFIKPLDEPLLHDIFKTFKYIITVEDGTIKGGFGSAILEFAAEHNYQIPIKTLGIPDTFIEHGSIAQLQELAQLDINHIAEHIGLVLRTHTPN